MLLSSQDMEELLERIEEPVDHALLERNDRVLGDRDRLRTDLAAARRDIAVSDVMFMAQIADPIRRIERMHLQRGGVDQKTRTDELVVHMVLAQNMANVLA